MTAATSLPEPVTPLDGARIVLGVSGGIAAYKSVEVCRRLVDAGAHVTPVMTEGATHFLGPTTLTALASEPVRTSLWEGADAIPHTRLGQTADLIVVAPCTARVVSAYAHGLSTDLLTNILIATRAPVVVAPAMHTEMWEHPAVVANIELLAARGVHIVPPEVGRLAGGDVGAGRLADPATIVAAATAALGPRDLAGLRVVVTAGGTREPIDAVRVIANRSSGRQGHALAAEAQRRGAMVTLITAAERAAPAGVDVVRVETAEEMRSAVHAVADADVIVMSAAVADFRPVAPQEAKIKKSDGIPTIELERTVDILAELGASRRPTTTLVGFAAETSDVQAYAQAKLVAKGADLIVANDVSADEVGFGHTTNAVTIVAADGVVRDIALTSKDAVSVAVFDEVARIRSTVR
ncbi:MAG: bifunctional phosphopantothenoylcysteine decarboxylase/phosphopantothenate--cysteine ligase CoaBC [Ilumatobacteraceae bacterium]